MRGKNEATAKTTSGKWRGLISKTASGDGKRGKALELFRLGGEQEMFSTRERIDSGKKKKKRKKKKKKKKTKKGVNDFRTLVRKPYRERTSYCRRIFLGV